MLLEVSFAVGTFRFWDIRFGWMDIEVEDKTAFTNASVLTIAFLPFKLKVYVFYGNPSDY